MENRFCANPLCRNRDRWTRFLGPRFRVQSDPCCSAACLREAVGSAIRVCLSRPTSLSLPSPRKARIGAILMSKQLISREQLTAALEEQHQSGRPLGECLVQLGHISHRDLTVALSEQHGLPWLGEFVPSPSGDLLSLLPKRVCQTFRVFPVEYRRTSESLVVVLGGPFESYLIPMFRRMLQCEVHPFVGDDEKVGRLIERYLERFPDEESHLIQTRGDGSLEVMVREIVDFRRAKRGRQLWIDLFRNTLWLRCRSRRRFSNLFLELGDEPGSGFPSREPERSAGLRLASSGKELPGRDAEIAASAGGGPGRGRMRDPSSGTGFASPSGGLIEMRGK